jgi:phosphoglucomutase
MEAFDSKIVKITDYLTDVIRYTDGRPDEKLEGVDDSDVMEFDLSDGCKILARPSGTEPKLKIYYTGVGKTEEEANGNIDRMKAVMKKFIE